MKVQQVTVVNGYHAIAVQWCPAKMSASQMGLQGRGKETFVINEVTSHLRPRTGPWPQAEHS